MEFKSNLKDLYYYTIRNKKKYQQSPFDHYLFLLGVQYIILENLKVVWADCRILFIVMLSAVIFKVSMQNGAMPNVIMLSVVTLNVVIFSVSMQTVVLIVVMMSVEFYLLLCWMSLFWIWHYAEFSLCWVSWEGLDFYWLISQVVAVIVELFITDIL